MTTALRQKSLMDLAAEVFKPVGPCTKCGLIDGWVVEADGDIRCGGCEPARVQPVQTPPPLKAQKPVTVPIAPAQPALPTPPPDVDLSGVLVALHLQGVDLERDGERLIARPAEGQPLDADTTALIRQSKPQLLEHLELSDQERLAALLGAYESVLATFGRGVQALYVSDGRQSETALQAERGFKAALARYEFLSLEAS